MLEIEINTILFLAVVVVASVVQTITGFAMGLVCMAGIALLGVADIAFAAAVVSFISLANTGIGLRRGYKHVDWDYLKWMAVGFFPAMALALALLTYLSQNYYHLLKLLLGVVIILAGSMLMISPAPYEKKTGTAGLSVIGVLGGIVGGLYSAGGGPIAYFMYRQPIDLNVIRYSLLAVIAISTFARSIMIALSGQMTKEIIIMSAISIPVVIVVTIGVSRYLRYIPDKMVRSLVYVVLLLVGGFLVIGSIFDV